MFKKHMLLRFHLLCTMENLLFENFQFFDLIFEGRATFKGMKHVTQRRAKDARGTKLFLRPRATILAIKNTLGQMS